MICREPKDHITDCYFCIVKTTRYNSKNKSKMQYLSLPSAMRPQSHSVEIPIPVFRTLSCVDQDEYDVEVGSSTDSDFVIKDDCVRKRFDPNELSDLAR